MSILVSTTVTVGQTSATRRTSATSAAVSSPVAAETTRAASAWPNAANACAARADSRSSMPGVSMSTRPEASSLRGMATSARR